jgi:two-component system LytT family response regulator
VFDVQMPGSTASACCAKSGERLPAVILSRRTISTLIQALSSRPRLFPPFSDERSGVADRAKQQLGEARAILSWRSIICSTAIRHPPHWRPRTAPTERLVISPGPMLRVGEIEWIDAEGDYLRIHVGKAWHLLRETMKHLEGQLDPARFVRIHRSTIVNLEKVKELQPFFRGEYVVVLQTGVTLKLSRGYREHLEAKLGQRF